MTQQECETVDNGLLMKGLRTAIVSVVLSCNDMISQWDSTDKSDQGNPIPLYPPVLIDTVNSDAFAKLQFLLKYIGPAVNYLNDIVQADLAKYLAYQQEIEQIKFAVFLVVMFLIFLIFWMPYLNNLSKQIWRTKVTHHQS